MLFGQATASIGANRQCWRELLDIIFGVRQRTENTAYLCGRRKIEFEVGPKGEGVQVQSVMLASEDGLIWRKHALFQEIQGDEPPFVSKVMEVWWASDGEQQSRRRFYEPSHLISSGSESIWIVMLAGR